MIKLSIGDQAPEIEALDQDGKYVSLKSYNGKKVILFFYPKADTPGCTAEACNLRDNYSLLTGKGFKIIGVSADDIKKQHKFANKYSLPFPLIPDTERKIINDYGVWGPKKFMGKQFDGINRTTFVISENGKIEKILTKVETNAHSEQILKEYNN